MGLSDQERTGKILHCVREIIEKAEKLENISLSYSCENKIKRLIAFCNNLWPTLLGGENNSVHWLIGSSSHNTVTRSNEDLWSVAVYSSVPYVENGQIINTNDDFFSDIEIFNPIKGTLTIPNLLADSDKKDLACVCEIYELIENIIYALRRYNDDYLKNRKEFSDLIANMQGTCFSILYENKYFTDCYIVHQICKILYADHCRLKEEKAYKDVVDEWLHAQHMHHDIIRVIGRSGETTEWLTKQHLILLGSEGIELKRNRVFVALRMAGRRYYYDHQHKQMLEIFRKDKELVRKPFLAAVAVELSACKKAKVEDDEASSKNYKKDNDPSALYGWNSLPEKKIIVPKKIKKIKKNAKTKDGKRL